MEILLPLVRDSHNSYPTDKLQVTIGDELIALKIVEPGFPGLSADAREVSVKRVELLRILRMLELEETE